MAVVVPFISDYYRPPPGGLPNPFAAFMSGFNRRRNEWALPLFEARLKGMNPVDRSNALNRARETDLAYAKLITQERLAGLDLLRAGMSADAQIELGKIQADASRHNATVTAVATKYGADARITVAAMENNTMKSAKSWDATGAFERTLRGIVYDPDTGAPRAPGKEMNAVVREMVRIHMAQVPQDDQQVAANIFQKALKDVAPSTAAWSDQEQTDFVNSISAVPLPGIVPPTPSRAGVGQGTVGGPELGTFTERAQKVRAELGLGKGLSPTGQTITVPVQPNPETKQYNHLPPGGPAQGTPGAQLPPHPAAGTPPAEAGAASSPAASPAAGPASAPGSSEAAIQQLFAEHDKRPGLGGVFDPLPHTPRGLEAIDLSNVSGEQVNAALRAMLAARTEPKPNIIQQIGQALRPRKSKQRLAREAQRITAEAAGTGDQIQTTPEHTIDEAANAHFSSKLPTGVNIPTTEPPVTAAEIRAQEREAEMARGQALATRHLATPVEAPLTEADEATARLLRLQQLTGERGESPFERQLLGLEEPSPFEALL
ncbi:MAG: hypothetical protein GY788_21115 [bacterium]|nr:hypothetical protein [bacterium]